MLGIFYPPARLAESGQKAVVGERLVEIVYRIKIETVKRIVKIGRCEYETSAYRKFPAIVSPFVPSISISRKARSTPALPYRSKAGFRIGVGLQFDVTGALTEFLYDFESKRLIVNGYASDFIAHES